MHDNTSKVAGQRSGWRWLWVILAVILLVVLSKIITDLLPFPIPQEFFIGLFQGIVIYTITFYFIPSLGLTTDGDKALHLDLLARRPLRRWLKVLIYQAVVVVVGLVLTVAASYLFDKDSSLQQRLLTWGSLLSGLIIGLLIARAADAFMPRRTAMKEEGGNG